MLPRRPMDFDVTESLLKRFWAKVDTCGGDKSKCWNWTAMTNKGYGMFAIRHGKPMWAHRIAYRIEFGPFDPVETVRHKCDNTVCVNPWHLELGSHADNMRDMLERNRGFGALKNSDIVTIRQMAHYGMSSNQIQEHFPDVPIYTIVNAAVGRTAKHIKSPPPVKKMVRRRWAALSEEQVSEIKTALANPYVGIGNDLARKYGVSRTIISNIRRGIADSGIV